MIKLLKKIINKVNTRYDSKEFEWQDIKEIKSIASEIELNTSIILVGDQQANIYLNKDTNIWIKGKLEGAILGESSNIVKVSGTVTGLISTYALECLEGSKIKGVISTSKLKSQEGVTFDVKAIPVEQTEVLKYKGINKTNIFRSPEFSNFINMAKG